MAHGLEGDRDLPRRLQAHAADVHRRRDLHGEGDRLRRDAAGHEGYITVGLYSDTRQPGEIFITLGKAGSTLAGFADAFATAISFSLQHGVELRFLADKFSHVRFEPSGFTGNPDIPMAKSIVDYVFRWLAQEFLPEEQRPGAPLPAANDGNDLEPDDDAKAKLAAQERAVFVSVRNGACYACVNCGATSGCS